MSPVSNRMGPY